MIVNYQLLLFSFFAIEYNTEKTKQIYSKGTQGTCAVYLLQYLFQNLGEIRCTNHKVIYTHILKLNNF